MMLQITKNWEMNDDCVSDPNIHWSVWSLQNKEDFISVVNCYKTCPWFILSVPLCFSDNIYFVSRWSFFWITFSSSQPQWWPLLVPHNPGPWGLFSISTPRISFLPQVSTVWPLIGLNWSRDLNTNLWLVYPQMPTVGGSPVTLSGERGPINCDSLVVDEILFPGSRASPKHPLSFNSQDYSREQSSSPC